MKALIKIGGGLRGFRLAKRSEEGIGILVADDSCAAEFTAVGAEKDDPGWAEQAKALEQGLVGRVVGSDVGLEQQHLVEA